MLVTRQQCSTLSSTLCPLAVKTTKHPTHRIQGFALHCACSNYIQVKSGNFLKKSIIF